MELAAVETAAAEALLFSRSAAIAGSLWAWWLAAMAAAVGLWRFRSAAAVSRPSAAVGAIAARVDPPPPTKSDAGVPVAGMESLTLPHVRPAAERFRLNDEEEDCFCTPKGKFTAYFHKEAGEGEGVTEKALGDEVDWQAEAEEEATEVRSRRTVDLGWYSYQDRAALNGSVVRLWDGDRKLTTAVPLKPALGRRSAGKVVLRGKMEMCF